MEKRNKILMTGGHAATTALAVVQEIKTSKKNWDIWFVGSKYALEGQKVTTLEYELLPKEGVHFLPITTGRVQRRFTLFTIPSILKIPFGFLQSFYFLLKIRPDITLSFGGYTSYPVVIASKILGIPVVIHEQTTAAGRASIFAAQFADKIALARESSIKFFPPEKCVVIGNPIVSEIAEIKPKSKISSPPVIYITGGSRGSQNVNNVVALSLPRLLAKYVVIHQTGDLDIYKFAEFKTRLPVNLSKNYEPFSRKDPKDVAKILRKADVLVARAGANTVSEILAVKRPAILIPLPISFMDEQTKNAQTLSKIGLAEIIPQAKLLPEILIEKIEQTVSKYSEIIKKVKDIESPDQNAARKLVQILSQYTK